jgi:pimeloyl-ACP methyl ester carboxylesterase
VINAGDVELSVHDTGGDAPAVVLLHGLAGCAEEWLGTRRGLQSAYRVVTFDQRGHGGSSRHPDDVSRASYVNDVVAVAETLGLGRIMLVGQSMGGHTALLVAANYPELVERLVLVESGVGGGGSALTAEVAAMLGSWPVPFADHAVAAEWFGGGRVGQAWADGLEARNDGLWPRFDVDVLVRSLAAVHQREAWTEWENISQPTLLVCGTDGLIPGAEIDRMLGTHPRARQELLQGAGHDLHLEAEDRWLGILKQFLGEPGH